MLHSSEKILPAPPNMIPVVSRWRRLASMERKSPDFLPLLSSLSDEANRSLTTELCGDDARVALGIIDEVLKEGKIPGEYVRDALCTMRMLAYNSGQVPSHYQVDRQSLRVEKDVIARGAFADVREGRLGGRTVAVRSLRIDQQTDIQEAQKRFCKECIIWMNVSHPNILELIAVDIDPRAGRYSMVSEMMTNGSIKEFIRKNSANRHRLLEEVATGLHYLHKRGIVHGDLKGQNILMTNETPSRACLADFGLSTFTPGTQGAATTNTNGGTAIFMAPELMYPSMFNKLSARPTQPTDIYALGMTIYEVLTGFYPFHEQKWTEHELAHNVVTGVRPTKPADAERIGFTDGIWELVQECWDGESTKRPKIDQVLTLLARVAAYSEVVDPTPDKPRERAESVESDFSSKIRLFLSKSKFTGSKDSTSLAGPRSVASTVSTASSGIAPPPSSDRRGPRSKFKLPIIESSSQLSIFGTKIFLDPKMMNSTVPMFIPFAMAPKPKHSGWHEFIDKMRAISSLLERETPHEHIQ